MWLCSSSAQSTKGTSSGGSLHLLYSPAHLRCALSPRRGRRQPPSDFRCKAGTEFSILIILSKLDSEHPPSPPRLRDRRIAAPPKAKPTPVSAPAPIIPPPFPPSASCQP